MDASYWSRVQTLFEAALDRSEEEREAFLDQACGDDDALRRDVASLLESDSARHSLLDGEPLEGLDLDDALSMEGREVGPYRVVREIGRGGMGAVYLAERSDGQFEQRVALKLLARGMDSVQILRRFEGERRILARLEHPNIARILDGGLAEDGRPWFAMEYVDGEPLDDWCDGRRLSIEERLTLFLEVCDAVRYAHARLVVHRDLKPDNIFVTGDGSGRPRVKLLDFGISKLLEENREGLTRTGMAVMTPAYASPEQVRGQAVSTSTDVYSLGVVLYGLLTGARPYELESSSPVAAAEVISTVEPERPSTAARKAAADGDAGRARGLAPERLQRRLSGDLDVICLMALRKESERRYASVDALRDDIRRHLDGLPVTARPDTLGYRAQKFVARHRVGLGAAALVVILLASLSAFYTTRLQTERDLARQEAETAEQVVAFMETLFESSSPAQARGDAPTVREVVDSGAVRLRTELAGEPAVRARLLDVLAGVYQSLYLHEEAEALLVEAVQDWRGLGGEARAGLAESLNKLGSTQGQLLRQDEALATYQEALAVRRALDGEESLGVAELLNNMALIRIQQGELVEAERVLREAIEMERAVRPGGQVTNGGKLYNLAYLVSYRGGFDEARALYRRAEVLIRSEFGDDHPNTVAVMTALADAVADGGDLAAADSILGEVLVLNRRIHGEESINYAFTLSDLGRVRSEEGMVDEAVSLQHQAIDILRTHHYPEAHPNLASVIESLGMVHYRAEAWAEAAEALGEALEMRRQVYDPPHHEISNNMGNLALMLRRAGRLDEAEALYLEALEMDREMYGEDHLDIATGLYNLAGIDLERGDLEGAEARYTEALEMRRRLFGEDHAQVAVSLGGLARLEEARGEMAAAEDYLLQALEVRRAVHGAEDHPYVVTARERLAELRARRTGVDAGSSP